ncbi:MAG: lamin tail domain-containing protein [Verrucomicrobiales bacterium]
MLGQFRDRGWYPATEAPFFNQHGGSVPANFPLEMRRGESGAQAGTIYYTTDGTDPRVAFAGSPTPLTLVAAGAAKFAAVPASADWDTASPNWREVGFDHAAAGWASGTLGAGYESDTGYEALIDPNFNFLAQLQNVNGSLYLRAPFTVADPSQVASLTLQIRYDDAFIAYLNGAEVARQGAGGTPGTPLPWNAEGQDGHSDSEAVTFVGIDLTAHLDKLVAGDNVLAIHGLNTGRNSSDMLIHPTLVATLAPPGGGSDIAPSAQVYTAPVALADSAQVKARLKNGSEWSALADATFIVGATPAGAANLAVSKIHYRPAGPTQAEIDAGFANRRDFEFLELMNIGAQKIDLTGVAFDAGIDFAFDAHSNAVELAPGGRLVIASNLAAFAMRYGSATPVAGQFQAGSNLDNNGETIRIVDGSGGTIRDFRYEDAFPWPEAADGSGASLVLIAPESNPDHALPENWRSSAGAGGAPGSDDRQRYAAWRDSHFTPAEQASGLAGFDVDADLDGVPNGVEYLGGSHPRDGSSLPPMAARLAQSAGEAYAEFQFTIDRASDDARHRAALSTDLAGWQHGAASLAPTGPPAENGDGTETWTYRSAQPLSALGGAAFFRLEADLRE